MNETKELKCADKIKSELKSREDDTIIMSYEQTRGAQVT